MSRTTEGDLLRTEVEGLQQQVSSLGEAYDALLSEARSNDARLRDELGDAREQLSAHDAIRAQLESERDALRAELGAVNGN